MKKLPHVRLAIFGALSPREVSQALSVLMKRPTGMKYMLAMLCSNPAATKAAIGGIMLKILSVVLRALKHNQTARQTRALQKMPRTKACTKS